MYIAGARLLSSNESLWTVTAVYVYVYVYIYIYILYTYIYIHTYIYIRIYIHIYIYIFIYIYIYIAGARLLSSDESLWTVTAWNDNGLEPFARWIYFTLKKK
jgi:hypothetical protein